MFHFSNHTDPLRCQNRRQSIIPDKLIANSPKNTTNIFNCKITVLLKKGDDFWYISLPGRYGEVGEKSVFVDVFPRTFYVYQSNYIIEYLINLLCLNLAFYYAKDRLFDHFHRFLRRAQKRKQLIYQI